MKLRDVIEKIITDKLDTMPNYEEYMVNSTMKVLLPPELLQLCKQWALEMVGEDKDYPDTTEKWITYTNGYNEALENIRERINND